MTRFQFALDLFATGMVIWFLSMLALVAPRTAITLWAEATQHMARYPFEVRKDR
jgi:hypothetical protein